MPRNLTVTPVGWLSRGEAFVPGDRRQLAIFGGIPGEAAEIRIFSENNHQVRSRVVRVRQPSPHRVDPPCPKWGPCAGCPWMHLDVAGRGGAIRSLLTDAFGDVPVVVDPAEATGADQALTLDVLAGRSDDGHIRVGVPTRDGPGLVAIPACLRADPLLRSLMTALVGAMMATDTWPAGGRTGSLIGASLRRIPGTDQAWILLDVARPGLFTFAEKLASLVPAIRGVVARRKDGDHIEYKRLFGDDLVEAELLGVRMRIGAHDAWPVSLRALDVDGRLAEDLELADGDAVIDVGEGARHRALHLARTHGWAMGMEMDETGLVRARETATKNRIPAEFVYGAPGLVDAAERLRDRRPLVHAGLGHRELDELVRAAILGATPRRVSLTSDNPRALAKEIRFWQGHGFTLSGLRATEVLPWSSFWTVRATLRTADDGAPVRRAPRRRTVR